MCYRQISILELATFLFLASTLLGCLGEQLRTDHPNKEEHQLPHFDSVFLSGPPLNNIHQVNQNADVLHSKNNHSLPVQPSSSAHNEGSLNKAKIGNNTFTSKNLEINITKDQNEQDILPTLQKNPLIQNLLNAGSKLTKELNMTIYLIKQNNDSKIAPLNTSKTSSNFHQDTKNLSRALSNEGINRSKNNMSRKVAPLNTSKTSSNFHQDTKNLSRALSNEGIHRSRNNMSRKVVPQNITVFLDTPESVESIPKALPSNDIHNLTDLTTIMKEQQMLENIQKTWSWNQRTGSRWPNRRVGGRRNRWRRPSTGRRPASGGRFRGTRPGQGMRPPQGGWTRPSQGGNQVNSLRPNQGGTGGQPSGVGSNGGSNTNQGDSEFEQEALDAHNKFRAVHNAPPMKLNNELSQQAKAYAQKIAALGALQHSSSSERGQDVGENLAMGCSSFGNPMSGKKAVTNWYNEVCQYDFNNPGFSMNTGHFTQVVWQDSTELGIGKATGQMGQMPCVYVVGRYRTAGNFNNMFRQQVLRGAFDKSYCNNVKNDE